LARLWLAIHERANFPRKQQFGRFLSEADITGKQDRPNWSKITQNGHWIETPVQYFGVSRDQSHDKVLLLVLRTNWY